MKMYDFTFFLNPMKHFIRKFYAWGGGNFSLLDLEWFLDGFHVQRTSSGPRKRSRKFEVWWLPWSFDRTWMRNPLVLWWNTVHKTCRIPTGTFRL